MVYQQNVTKILKKSACNLANNLCRNFAGWFFLLKVELQIIKWLSEGWNFDCQVIISPKWEKLKSKFNDWSKTTQMMQYHFAGSLHQ